MLYEKKLSLQLSSEQSVGDVLIAQLDRKRVPQARSSGCKGSVAVTGRNVVVCSILVHLEKYFLPVSVFYFWPQLSHPAARSLRDSRANC